MFWQVMASTFYVLWSVEYRHWYKYRGVWDEVYEFSGVWVAVHFSLPGTKQPDYVENNFCWSISERCRNIHVLCAGQMEINAIIAYMDNHDSCSSVQDRKRWNARSWWQAEDNRFCRVEYTMTLVSLKLAFHNL